MADRKNKSRVTHDVNSAEPLSTTSSDNFISFFLTLCEEYDVTPLPKVKPFGNSSVALTSVTSKRRTDRDDRLTRIENLFQDKTEVPAPIIHVTYERSMESNDVEKIECKGHDISVCMLDALGLSVEKFRTVTTIKLQNCRINAFGISQIAEIIRDLRCVKDLNLDMNPNIQENYHLLCTPMGKLWYLSLKYCNISDLGLVKIANELKYRDNEMSELIGLNLANNRITDVGAEHIATMLHTNRSLQSLVLTGNRIGDIGASLMIQELCMYPLNHEEIVEIRRRNYQSLRERDEKLANSLTIESRISMNSRENSSSRKISKTSRTRKNTNAKKLVADKRNNSTRKSEIDTTIIHPLNTESREIKGHLMAIGNFELQHLNLSYNSLTDETLKKIIKCIFYQSYTMLNDTGKGLIHVNLEGNDFRNEEDSKQFRELLRNRVSPQYEEN